jgi:ATPase subunit of ABC transporter with duplicated ATPase domains
VLDGAVVERGSFRLGPVDLELCRGDRLALVGPNGSGKTTLLAALLGELPLAAGRRRLGAGARIGSPRPGSRALRLERAAAGAVPLVLDEPSNHLDIEAIEELESALAGFDGAVVLVTHDRRLLDAFGPTRTLELRA